MIRLRALAKTTLMSAGGLGIALGCAFGCALGCAHGGKAYVASKDAVELNNKASDLVATDPTQAIELLDRALATDPDYPLAMGNKATALGRLGRYDEAAAELEKLQARHPEMLKAVLSRGVYLERGGKPEQAQAAYREAVEGLTQQIKRKPGDVDLYCQRAYGYFLLGESEEAGHSLDAIERQAPDDRRIIATRKILIQSTRDDVVANYGGVHPVPAKPSAAAEHVAP